MIIYNQTDEERNRQVDNQTDGYIDRQTHIKNIHQTEKKQYTQTTGQEGRQTSGRQADIRQADGLPGRQTDIQKKQAHRYNPHIHIYASEPEGVIFIHNM